MVSAGHGVTPTAKIVIRSNIYYNDNSSNNETNDIYNESLENITNNNSNINHSITSNVFDNTDENNNVNSNSYYSYKNIDDKIYVTENNIVEVFVTDEDCIYVTAVCGSFFDEHQIFEVRYNSTNLKQTFENNRILSESRFPTVFSIADVSIFKMKNTEDKKITILKNFINNKDYLDRIHYPIRNAAFPNKNFEQSCLGLVDFEIFNLLSNSCKKGQLNIIGYGHRQYTINGLSCFEILYIAKLVVGSPEVVEGDSGSPVYINNKLHSFINSSAIRGGKEVLYIFLTPANLVLKQVEKLLGEKCFFCTLDRSIQVDTKINKLKNKKSKFSMFRSKTNRKANIYVSDEHFEEE